MKAQARTQARSIQPLRFALISLLALGALLVLGACSDHDPVSVSARAPRAALTDEQGYTRLVVGVDVPEARILLVDVEAGDLKEPMSWRFERGKENELFGTIAVPAGDARTLVLRALDGDGRELYVGKTELAVEKETNPLLRFALEAVDERLREQQASGGGAPVEGWIGSYRIAVEPGTLGRPSEEPVLLTVTVRDPDGEAMPMGPEEIDWQWPREVGELEVVYSGRDAFEASAWWRLKVIDAEIKPVNVVICSQLAKGCRPVHHEPFEFLKYTKIVGGGAHTCAIIAGWSAKCWGSNSSGQTGVDAYGTDHVAGRAFMDISAGTAHTCALDMQGQALCWGSNAYDQLGLQGQYRPGAIAAPEPVQNTPAFTQIAAGGRHTCALSAASEIWCWGEWRFGQLGDGAFYQSYLGQNATPRTIASTDAFVAVSSGESHSCGVTTIGGVMCWGLNNRGQTGAWWQPSSTMNAFNCQEYPSSAMMRCNRKPTGVSIPGGATKIASGGHRNCALNTSGDIYCWGAFALGSNTTTADSLHPIKVNANGGSVKFTAVGVGTTHSCGVATDGVVWCWGYGGSGQLGNGGSSYVERLPVAATPQPAIVASSLGLGGTHSCAVAGNGHKLYCWGLGTSGQIGDGGFASRAVPTAVTAF
jgi:alpha-tubulin suppressor-like RCC1 family protein